MKTEQEIENRIDTYETNIKMLKNFYAKDKIKALIQELKWVLGKYDYEN